MRVKCFDLPLAEREELTEQLYLSLAMSADPTEDVKAAWSEEIARRLDDVDAGRVPLVSSAEMNAYCRRKSNPTRLIANRAQLDGSGTAT
jgi:putative addiction module component (TIGR02574 family)